MFPTDHLARIAEESNCSDLLVSAVSSTTKNSVTIFVLRGRTEKTHEGHEGALSQGYSLNLSVILCLFVNTSWIIRRCIQRTGGGGGPEPPFKDSYSCMRELT